MSPPRRSLDPQAFLPLTPTVFEVLLALAQDDLHGYAVMQNVERRTAGRVRILPGTLYRALDRLLDSRLVEEIATRESDDDQRRRYYRLTPLGRRVLAAETERLAEQVRAARKLRLKPSEEG